MAINDMMYRFGGNHKPNPAKNDESNADREIGNLIGEAGRSEVFARAKSLGWLSGELPPKWVWQSICAEINAEKKKGVKNGF